MEYLHTRIMMRTTHQQSVPAALVVMVLLLLMISNAAVARTQTDPSGAGAGEHVYSSLGCRAHTASLTDFGGVGDGKTSNTQAFQKAIAELSKHQNDGGSLLYVPPGKWLTGSFNLTSHFTLFLDKDATILASQEESDYPVIEPLPSYGQGRDAVGPRYASLVFGYKLEDVVITGDNGTIEGQGDPWWSKFKKHQLKYTRPYLIELMYCTDVLMTNITMKNSPSWHVHPVYSKNLIFRHLTILAPVEVPNTDGINPDSCNNTLIENVYIVSGDDCIAVKSGWDQFGIDFGMPTQQLQVRRLTCISPKSAVIALGSEMSGGISDVRVEEILAVNSESGVRIKTGRGRGGYVKDIYARNLVMKTMKMVFWITGDYGSHPGDHFNLNAMPKIGNINYRDVVAENVTMAADLVGIAGNTFTGLCISNVTVGLAPNAVKNQWNCSDVAGFTCNVKPPPCAALPEGKIKPEDCKYPADKLPIEGVKVQTCSYKK